MYSLVLKHQNVILQERIILHMMHLLIFCKDSLQIRMRCEINKQHCPTENDFLIADDTLLDKPYAKKMDLVYHQWSEKQHRIVNGINVSILLWTEGSDRFQLTSEYTI
jgi:hypothetical protein